MDKELREVSIEGCREIGPIRNQRAEPNAAVPNNRKAISSNMIPIYMMSASESR